MTDERLGMAAGAWLRDIDRPPRDSRASVQEAMTEVRETRQVRRWWPLPAFDRHAPIPATNGRQPARGFTMFSALKFVVAAAIVALFGGFLLTGVLTTQQDGEVPPAAVSASPTTEAEPDEATQPPEPEPSPTTTPELLSGMVTEEVEPGIYRVINDGVRDLASKKNRDVVAGHDGGIWVVRGESGFFRLGSEDTHAWPTNNKNYIVGFHVAPDGTVWTVGQKGGDPNEPAIRIRSFDGQSWTLQKSARDTYGIEEALHIAPDGSVWAAWADPKGEASEGFRDTIVARLGADGWEPLGQTIKSIEGEARLFVTESGDIWAAHRPDDRLREGGWRGWRLSRYVDGAWQQEGPEVGWGGTVVDIGTDGTVWLRSRAERESTDVAMDAAVGDLYVFDSTLRFDAAGWQSWSPTDGVPVASAMTFRAAPDGSLWVAMVQGEGFEASDVVVGHFDGSTWRPYLTGTDRRPSIDVAADGLVWVLANIEGDPEGKRDLYAITPEAVAASESRVVASR